MTSPEPFLPVPEDDALDAAASAVVDGTATPEEAALVAAAPDGAARVAALRAVANAVGSPVGSQDTTAAAAALATALAAFGDGGTGRDPAVAGGSAGPSAPVTRLRSAPGSSATPTGARSPRRLRVLAAVAAALVVLLGIGALSLAVLTKDDTTTFAAAPARDQAEKSAAPTSAAPSRSAPAGGAAGGAVAPAQSFAAGAAASGAPGTPAAGAVPAAGPPAPQPPPVVDGGGLGRQDDIEVVAQRAAAALDGIPDAAVAAPGAALPSDVQACAMAATATANEVVGPLRYRAVGTYQGTPAVFLAFDRTSGPPPHLLLVLARSGCALLASTHF